MKNKPKRTANFSAVPSQVNLLIEIVLSVERFNTSAGLCSFLLACVERMALGANFYVNVLLCGTYCKRISAVTGHCCLIILRMNCFLHTSHLFINANLYNQVSPVKTGARFESSQLTEYQTEPLRILTERLSRILTKDLMNCFAKGQNRANPA